ncbi:hypothetical protein OE88DRAFT_1807017 [Heliocybe sulcata]|uniref:PH domain-containing protein n=1 Tax=Heliocybe sulcata TaxID=5364 RepID=A0A5C3NHR9_9AGAM|nr:hypothetical protein OE88DRAFT_1807017 [Heliocybe sulcata]
MTSYTPTDPSSGPRSPLFGTATFSTLTPSDSRQGYSRTGTPIPHPEDGEDASTAYNMRRVNLSPTQSYTNTYSYTYSDEDSIDDAAEVEAALANIESELSNVEDALTEWSGSGPSYSTLTGSYTTSSTPWSHSSGPISTASMGMDRAGNRLSTITERTENGTGSRPTSGLPGSRPLTQHSATSDPLRRLTIPEARPASPVRHGRSTSETAPLPPPGRRAGDLIAFFEGAATPDRGQSGHARIASAPAGPRSPSPYFASPTGLSYSGGTGFGYSTAGYTSRPSSPTTSRTGTGSFSASSFLSPQPRATTTLSSDSRFPPTTAGRTGATTPTQTGTYPNTYSTFSSTLTPTTSSNTFTGTVTASSLRRPQTSPRSPLTSVRNIVAAWKERTPLGNKTGKAPASVTSGGSARSGQGEGLFSIRRRAERGQARLREQALGSGRSGDPTSYGTVGAGQGEADPRSTSQSISESALLPPPFDIAELGVYARGSQEPLRIGLLWYLNVHAPEPYRWQRCQALLYPHMLLLSWIATGGGRGVVTLDLLNCTEVRSVPTPMHPSAKDDVGTVAAKMQSEEANMNEGESGQIGETGLVETLCPFQLLYSDGIERLGAESARERVRWVSAVWEALDRSVTIPDRSLTGSPTGSIRTIRSMTSTNTESATGSGSASTTFMPPLDTIPDLSDLASLSGSSTRTPLSRNPSFTVSGRTRATDDAAVSGQCYLYPGDPRVIAPSRSSSLRRTSSLTDLDAEFASAVSRARNARPGLGFGLGLAAGVVLGEGSPVTISSGPRLGEEVRMSPPPSGRARSRPRGVSPMGSSEFDDDAFFSADSRSNGDSKGSSFYSSLSKTDFTNGAGVTATDTTVGFAITSGSDTNIVASTMSLRGPSSASYLGDSHDGSSTYDSTSASRSTLTRAGGVRRRTPGTSSRTFSSSYETRTDEGSDKENSEISGSTQTRSTDEYDSSSRGYSLTASSCSCGSSGTCSTCQSSSSGTYTDKASEIAPSEVPTIPSESNYETAEVCSTEYSTAEVCSTEYTTAEVCSTEYETAEVCSTEYETAAVCPTPSVSEYVTVDVCPSEPASEYITAEVCPTEVSTDYDTAECRCVQSVPEEGEKEEEEVEKAEIIVPPSPIPTIPSEIEVEIQPEDIPLPPSDYSPSWPPTEASMTEMSESRLEPTEDFTPTTVSSIDTFPSPSPVPPMESLPTTETPETISSPTESSPTPTVSELTPTVLSSAELAPTPTTPSIRESLWAPESDRSYDSSILQASPSVLSIAIPEGPDMSYETSGLRPSGTPVTTEPPRLSPIPELSTSVTPSSPTSITATPESVSTPTDVPTPSMVSEDRLVTVTRTPSTVSTLSSISMRSSIFEPRSLFEVPLEEEPTEPSLLSTRRSLPTPVPAVQRALSPAFVPLPTSPAPPTPSPPMSVSVATPRGDVPSIHSALETIASQPSEILTHDVNRLLQYLHELDQGRLDDHRELVDNIRDIRDELYDLSAFLQEKCTVEVPPPVPRKDVADRSVGDSSEMTPSEVARSDMHPSEMTPRPQLIGPRPIARAAEPRLIAIPLTPPPLRLPSPSSLTSTVSWLESPHSDDLSLMEAETYPETYPVQHPPSFPSDSPPSSPIESSSSSMSTPMLSSTESSGPYLSATSPSSPSVLASRASSPSSGATVRPRPPSLTLADLLENLEQLKQQSNALRDAQDSTNDMLGWLRDREVPVPDLTEFSDRIQRLEDLLRGAFERLQQPEESLYESAPSETSSDRERLQRILGRIGGRPEEPPVIRMPVPVRATPSIDAQLENLLGPGPQMPPPVVQPPPALIPFVYRPMPYRPRSASPTMEYDLPRRSWTAPAPEPHITRPPMRRGPRGPRRGGSTFPPRTASLRDQGDEGEPPVMPSPAPFPPGGDGAGRPPQDGDYGPDFLDALRELRRRRDPDRAPDGFLNLGVNPSQPGAESGPPRPPTAPADLGGTWYRPAPGQEGPEEPQSGAAPPPGAFIPAGAVPPGGYPINVLPPGIPLPPQLEDILEMLRENRVAQRASIEQQREIMRYLRGLNEWLARDVHDRQAEIRGVSARVDRLRDDLDRVGQPQYAAGVQPQFPGPPPPPMVGMPVAPAPTGPGGDTYVVPPLPSMGGPVIPPVMPGFQGPAPGMPQGPIVNVLPPGTPSDEWSPVIPPEPGYGPSQQYEEPPFVPPGPHPRPRPQTGYYPDEPHYRPGSEESVFIPDEQPPMSQPPMTIIPPPGGGIPQQGVPIVIQGPPQPQQQQPTIIQMGESRSETPTESRHGSPVPYFQPPLSQHRPYSPDQVYPVADRPSSPRHGSPRHSDVHPQPIIIQQPAPPGMSAMHPSGQPIVVQPPMRTGSAHSRPYSPPLVVRESRSPSRERPVIIAPTQPSMGHQPAVIVPSPQPHHMSEGPPVIIQSGAPTPYHEYTPSRQPSYSPSRPYEGRSPRGHHRTEYDDRGRSRSRSYSPEQDRTVVLEPRGRSGRTRFVDRHGRSRSPRPSDHVVAIIPGHRGRYSSGRRGGGSPRDNGSPRDGSPPGHVVVAESPLAPTTIMLPGGHPEGTGEHDPGRRTPHVLERPYHPHQRGSETPRIIRIPPSEGSPMSPGPEDEGDPGLHHPTDYGVHTTHPGPDEERDAGAPHPSHYGVPATHPDFEYPEESPPHVPSHGVPRTPSTRMPPSRAGSRLTAPPPQRTPSGATVMDPYEEEPHPVPEPHGMEPYEPPPPSPPPAVLRPSSPRTELHQGLTRHPSTAPYYPVESEHPGVGRSDPGLGRSASARTRTQYAPSVTEPPEVEDPTTIVHIPAHEVSENEDLMYADAERARQERFEDLERRMAEAAEIAMADDERRDQEFRQHEEERDRLFADKEAQRDEEAARRRDEIWVDLEQRLAAGGLPPAPAPPESIEAIPIPQPERIEPDTASIIGSMREAANQHATEIREIVNLERENLMREREEAEAERERLRAEAEAERAQLEQERENRIAQLEEELARTRAELEDERAQRKTEEAESRERARQEALERDEVVRGQLGDITNLAQENLECCTSKRQIMDERYAEKQTRREEKDAKFQALYDMVNTMMEESAAERQRAEAERAEAAAKPGVEVVIEELRRQNQELRELLNNMAESWRADSARQAEDTLNAVRATAQEQVPFNVQGYLDEFSKALASEVRMLLGEVGRLREERRNLQHEIGFLLCTRSKYGPGGEFDPEWRPENATYMARAPAPPPEPIPEPVPPPPEEPLMQARPGWRTIQPRSTRRARARGGQPVMAEPPPAPMQEMPRPGVSSWATWQPDPAFMPSPSSAMPEQPNLVVPEVPQGLFGPRSPRDSYVG